MIITVKYLGGDASPNLTVGKHYTVLGIGPANGFYTINDVGDIELVQTNLEYTPVWQLVSASDVEGAQIFP